MTLRLIGPADVARMTGVERIPTPDELQPLNPMHPVLPKPK